MPDPLWRLRHNTARPDILAADEAQPVEALFVGEVDSLRCPIHFTLVQNYICRCRV
jgi:hypothetical protein